MVSQLKVKIVFDDSKKEEKILFPFIKLPVIFHQKAKDSDICICLITRAVRGSDYSPATVLSEEKDKLVPENWRDTEKKYERIIPKPHAQPHSMQKHLQSFKTIGGKL